MFSDSNDSSGVRAYDPSEPQDEAIEQQHQHMPNANMSDDLNDYNQDYYDSRSSNYYEYPEENAHYNNNTNSKSIPMNNNTHHSTPSNRSSSAAAQYRNNNTNTRPPSSLMYNDNESMSTIHPEDIYRQSYDNRMNYEYQAHQQRHHQISDYQGRNTNSFDRQSDIGAFRHSASANTTRPQGTHSSMSLGPPPIPPPHSVSIKPQQPSTQVPEGPIPTAREDSSSTIKPVTANNTAPANNAYKDRTPSPLRNAMDEVLTSLDNLKMPSSTSPVKSVEFPTKPQVPHASSTHTPTHGRSHSYSPTKTLGMMASPIPQGTFPQGKPAKNNTPSSNSHFRAKSMILDDNFNLSKPANNNNSTKNVRPSTATGFSVDSDIPFGPHSFSPTKQLSDSKSREASLPKNGSPSLLVSRNSTYRSSSTTSVSLSVASRSTTPTTISDVSATSAGSFSRNHNKEPYNRADPNQRGTAAALTTTPASTGMDTHDPHETSVDLPTTQKTEPPKKEVRKPVTSTTASKTITNSTTTSSTPTAKKPGFFRRLFHGSKASNEPSHSDQGKNNRSGGKSGASTSLGFISGRKSAASGRASSSGVRRPEGFNDSVIQMKKVRDNAGINNSGSISTNRSTSSASVRDTLRKVSGKAFNGRTALSSIDFHHSTKSNTSLGISRHNTNLEKSLSRNASRSESRSASRNGTAAGHDTSRWIEIHRNVHRTNTLTNREKEQRAMRPQFDGSRVLKPIEALQTAVAGDETADGGCIQDQGPLGYLLQERDFAMVDSKIFGMNSWPYFTPGELARNFIVTRVSNDPVDQLRAAFDFCATKLRWESGFDGDEDEDDDMYGGHEQKNELNMTYDEHGNQIYSAQRVDICALSRIMQTRRASTLDIAQAFKQMCDMFGIYCEVVPGYLKGIGEIWQNPGIPRPNHYWNAVVIENQWRMVDASLANPSFPTRHIYTRCDERLPEFFYFLTRPTEFLYTHVPYDIHHEHVVPPMSQDKCIALPLAGPSAFMFNLELVDFSTALTRLEGLEVAEIVMAVPSEAEILVEVVAGNFPAGSAGTLVLGNALDQRETKPALAQVFWDDNTGERYYRIKAVLPQKQRQGALNIYVGARGVLQSISKNVLSLAYSIPIVHFGENPLFNFVVRHPTPHSDKQDIYINEPQCRDLVCGNMYVFSMRQHFSKLVSQKVAKQRGGNNNNNNINSKNTNTVDGNGNQEPTRGRSVDLKRLKSNASMLNSMSMYNGNNTANSRYSLMTLNGVGSGFNSGFNESVSSRYPLDSYTTNTSTATTNNNTTTATASTSAAASARVKMALQTPNGKILKLSRTEVYDDGSGLFEGTAKCNEPGIWRGLVLSDSGNAWSVFAEWHCS